MDILFPGIGEIVGGSQREERYDVLLEKMQALNIPEKEMWWYLDTRRFGSCVHSGFGLGFERLVLFVTGMTNIRSEEHTSELQSRPHLVCRLLLEKKKKKKKKH